MKALVTGGGGFLGRAIVQQLLLEGIEVRSFSRGDYPALRMLGVEVIRGDLSEAAAVHSACGGCDIVFHAAARAGIWGLEQAFYSTNVIGTDNVIEACRRQGIPRLVYTSSPSVVFDGTDMEGVDESVPYARAFKAPYPATKAVAEQRVLAANGAVLATVALRPHLIWGPGDTHLVPGILARGRAGRLRRLGRKVKRVDVTYVDNAAEAHLLAARRLFPGSAVAGRAYFISQGQPLPLWEFINRVLAAGDLPPVTQRVPARVGYAVGWLCELLYRFLPLSGEPPVTRFLAEELSTSHWFDISAARRDLGYHPRVSTEEGMRRLQQWLAAGG